MHYDDVNKLVQHQQMHCYVIYAASLLHIAYIFRHFIRLQGDDSDISLKQKTIKYVTIDLYIVPDHLVLLFIKFAGASYGRSVNLCSGTVGGRQGGGCTGRDLNEKTLAADNGR